MNRFILIKTSFVFYTSVIPIYKTVHGELSSLSCQNLMYFTGSNVFFFFLFFFFFFFLFLWGGGGGGRAFQFLWGQTSYFKFKGG